MTRPAGQRVVPEPLFLATPRGRRLVVRWRPPQFSASVLFLPPFAEEMNKCRPMMVRTARAMATRGMATYIVDPGGTGDSEGEFAAATADDWVADLADAAGLAEAEGGPVAAAVGVRFGALLLPALTQQLPALTRVALWAPQISGEMQLRQFLRLKVAAGLMGGGGRETVAGLRARLDAGETLEVAGYELSPVLARGLAALDLRELDLRPGARLRCFELSTAPEAAPGRALAGFVEECGTRFGADAVVLNGDAFWSTVEIALCPALVERTAGFIGGEAP